MSDTEVDDFIEHFGVKGMKWGVRKKDTSGLSRRDAKFVKRKGDKITAKAKKKSTKELSKFEKQLLKDPSSFNKSGQISSATMLAYNRKMAEVMNQKVSKIKTPSGKAIKFVAKRGDIGVLMAVADQGYNMERVKNGLHKSGRIAYKKETITKVPR